METATWLTELGVGIACLLGGVAAARTARLRIVGAGLLVAGLAATVHAAVRLAAG